jgi:anti-sigma B factor antagonist
MSDDAHLLPGGEIHRLDIKVEEDPASQTTKVVLDGRVDVFTYLDLAKQLTAIHEGRDGIKMVLDLSQVYFVASSGWSVFLALRSRLKRQGGRVALAGLNADLKRIYLAMKMAALIPAFDTAVVAAQALAQA